MTFDLSWSKTKTRFNHFCLPLGSRKWCDGERYYSAIIFTRKIFGAMILLEKMLDIMCWELMPSESFTLKKSLFDVIKVPVLLKGYVADLYISINFITDFRSVSP